KILFGFIVCKIYLQDKKVIIGGHALCLSRQKTSEPKTINKSKMHRILILRLVTFLGLMVMLRDR
ncbi:hypothetical protein, partial [Bacillus cereus]|uniref:hypothetical protein n=1 Tax=Bacillus cereus TaxID=1396 RepID=UPI001E3D4E12